MKHKEIIVLITACVIYILSITFLFVLKLYTLHSSAFDLGIFIQAFYSTLNGELLYSSPDFQIFGSRSFLGIHFSPIAFLLVIIYAIYPSWITLILFQAFTVSIDSLILYKLTLHVTGCRRKALTLSLLYLVNPLIISANLYDYHLESLGPLLYFCMYYCYLKGSLKYQLLFGLMLVLINEGFILITLFFSLYAIIKARLANIPIIDKRVLASVILLVMCIILLPTSILIMHSFLERELNDYVSDVFSFYFGNFLYNLHFKVIFWIVSLASLGFLPLNAPLELIPAIPYILVSFSSQYVPFYTIGWQYSFFYMPAFFVAAAHSLKKRDFNRRIFAIILGLSIAINPVTIALLKIPAWAGGYDLELDVQKAMHYAYYIERILNLIEHNSTILASARIFPFVANNLNSFVIVEGNITGKQLSNYLKYTPKAPTYILLDNSYTPILEHLQIDGKRYATLAQAESILLVQMDYNDTPQFYIPYSKFFLPDNFYVHKHILYKKIKDYDFDDVFHYRGCEYDINTTLFYGPYVTLPRGTYVAHFYLKFSNISNDLNNIFLIDVNRYPHGIISYRVISRDQIIENKWISVDIVFSVYDLVYHNLEFRGTALASNINVYFAGVKIEQIDPYPDK